MRILALETSGLHGSIATLSGHPDGAQVVGQSTLATDKRTAQSLAPAVQSLLAETGWTPATIELIAIAVGPGSFTGLRIGVTTAKTFAYAVGAQIVGVNTLTVLAHQARVSSAPVWAVMDAQRGELFVARYATDSNGARRITREASIAMPDAWLGELQIGDSVTGPATRRVLSRLPNGVAVVPEAHWQPTAVAVGQVGWQAYCAGHRDDVWQLAPQYYRQSAAEERLS